jgi:predicted metal-binding membrane protein
MSMMWMPMGGEFAAAGMFVLTWLAMMVAMMLPSAMVAVAVVIALEKLLPRGEWLARAARLVAIVAGIIIAALSVPAL